MSHNHINQLHIGDCLPWLEQLPAESMDALITDPPYASGGLHMGTRQQSTIAKYQINPTQRGFANFTGDSRDQRSHYRWSMEWLTASWRALKPGAPFCVFSDWRQIPLTTDALQGAGFTWRGIAVWDKTEGTRPVPGRFRAQAEFIIWGSKGDMPVERGVGVLPGVVRQCVRTADKHHLTGKPTSVMRYLTKICPPGGIILDPFAGSGTTLVAAQLEGYQWAGCEISAHYGEIAKDRLTQAMPAWQG